MSNENLQKWALVAEIFGGVAIVFTLAFLAIQMRENTNAIQAQTYQVLMQELNGYREFIADPTVASIMVKVSDNGWQSLTEEERIIRAAVTNIRFGIYESAYYANERGVLGTSEWDRFKVAICRGVETEAAVLGREGRTPMSELLTDEFMKYIDDNCS